LRTARRFREEEVATKDSTARILQFSRGARRGLTAARAREDTSLREPSSSDRKNVAPLET
jgi:hypothetical protein